MPRRLDKPGTDTLVTRSSTPLLFSSLPSLHGLISLVSELDKAASFDFYCHQTPLLLLASIFLTTDNPTSLLLR